MQPIACTKPRFSSDVHRTNRYYVRKYFVVVIDLPVSKFTRPNFHEDDTGIYGIAPSPGTSKKPTTTRKTIKYYRRSLLLALLAWVKKMGDSTPKKDLLHAAGSTYQCCGGPSLHPARLCSLRV